MVLLCPCRKRKSFEECTGFCATLSFTKVAPILSPQLGEQLLGQEA